MIQHSISGSIPKVLKVVSWRNSHTPMFKIAKMWNRPKCPYTDEWISKIWHIHTMEYYSVFFKKKKWKSWLMLHHRWTLRTYAKWLKKETVTARDWGKEIITYYISVVQDEKRSRDGWWWGLYNNMNVLNATEAVHLKMIKKVIFLSFTTIRKWEGVINPNKEKCKYWGKPQRKQ